MPVVAGAPLWPALLGAMFCQEMQESPQSPVEAVPRDQQGRTADQATQPVRATPGISGELRGPVFAVPLDSRQIVLTGDERDIEFLTQMLSLMEGTAPAPEIRVFTLQNAKATALQQPLQQTVQALIQQLTQRPGRGDQFSIIAEARSNSLIVAASKTHMEMIAQIIEKLDFGTEVPSQFKTIPLYNVQAGEAVGILRPIIERLNRLRGTPAEAQAAIEPVDRANSVLIIGTPTDITEIESLLSEIDVELDPEQERGSFTIADVMVINLENAVAEDLARVLQELIETDRAAAAGAAGQPARRSAAQLIRQLRLRTPDGRELPKLDLDKPIAIRPEKGTNSLIVFSSPKNNEALREIVSLFDALPRGAEVDVKAIVVQHASAAALAEILQRVFDEGKAALRRPAEGGGQGLERGVMPPMPPGVAGRGLPFNVAVSFDERSNTVVVIGRKDAVLLAAGLITQLDKPGTDLNYRPFVISLKNMPAAELQTRLQEMLDKRAQALGGDRNAARDSAVLVADDRTNSLVMLASPDVYEMVSKLAAQLDGAESYRVVDSRLRRLQHADAAKLQGLLQDLFDKKKQAEGDLSKSKDVVHVLADARSNALMLTGTRDYLEEAERLIASLDQPFEPTVEFRVRPVLLNSASNIATLIMEMVEKTRNVQDAKTRGTPIHVAADPYSNNLLIAAASEDLIMVERWIEVLDRPAEPGRVVRIIPVRRQKAEELARQAQEIFGRGGGGGAGGAGTPDLSVAHDAVTNSVVAIGPPAVVKDIEETIRQLDEITPGANTVLKHFKLEQADAEDAGNLLRNILALQSGSVGGTRAGGGTGGSAAQDEAARAVMLIYQRQHPELGTETLRALRSSVTVIDDVRTNSLYILAPPESMPLMESLVAAVDIPPDAAKVRVFALRNSTAEEMVRTLEALFSGQSVQRPGGTGTGAGAQQERVLTLGEGLAEGGRQQLTFTTDARTNSVIAAGTRGYLDLVEELILQLDSQPIEERKTLVYEPRNTLPQAIQEAIRGYNEAEQQILSELREEISVSRRLERQILAVSSEDAKKVILSYDPRREADVLDLVRELDQPPPQVMIQVLIIEVGLDNSLELGVEFAYQDLQFTKAGPNDTTTFDYVVGTDIGAGGSGLGGFTFTISGKDFSFLLRALQSEGHLTVLSRPQIIAMDNQQAVIDISNDVPYVTGTSTTTGGQITTQVNREKVGIRLEVTPQINPDGYVRMEITQEVSDLTDSTVPVAPGVNAPIFFTRELSTVVTVRDNETVVLGGLITSRDSTNENKIPLVGDIPILGRLFTFTSNQTTRRELLLVLTPRVVRTVEDYRELSIQERDRTGMIPRDVVTHPLMNGLRVQPEDLPAEQTGRELGPFPAEDQAYPNGPAGDEYGPQPARPTPVEDSSYDVPITRRVGSAAGGG
jgi:type II secretion system protein D